MSLLQIPAPTVQPCLCRHRTISICDSFCFAWHFRMACLQQARTRILDRVGFLSHHGTSPGRARPSVFSSIQLRPELDSCCGSLPLKPSPRSGKPTRTAQHARDNISWSAKRQRRIVPEPQPSRRLTYRGTDPAGEKLAPAPFDTVASKRVDVLPNLTSSACPGADAASSHKLKSMSKACLRLLKALPLFSDIPR
jgi:hypothetical protein